MAPFAAGEDLFGDFFDGEVVEGVGAAAKGHAEDKEAAVWANLFAELGELFVAEVLGGDVDEVAFGGVALLPVEGFGRGVGEAFEFAEGFGEHFGVVGLVDDPVVPAVFFEQGGGEVLIAEAAAALPVDGCGDAAGIFVVDDFL